MHYLGKKDPTVMKLREQFRQSMTPEQQATDRRAYNRATPGEFGDPEERPYDQWFEIHRLDQYLGAMFLPKPNEWEGTFTLPQQQTLGSIRTYLEQGNAP